MKTRIHPWPWLPLLAVLSIACLWGQRWAGATMLTTEERRHTSGGDRCIRTTSTCNDPSIPGTCAYNMMGQYCYMCKPVSVEWH
jgi:hypothetical protein